MRKMNIQNKWEAAFAIGKIYVQNKWGEGVRGRVGVGGGGGYVCNMKHVCSKQAKLLFSLLVINNYYTTKMFLLRIL